MEGGRTQGDINAARVDDAGGGTLLDRVHVVAHTGKIGQLARRLADGLGDARQRALGEDGDVLGRGRGGRQGEDSAGGVLHCGRFVVAFGGCVGAELLRNERLGPVRFGQVWPLNERAW